MVHYNYTVKNWEVPKQKLLYFLFKELLLDMDLNGNSPRDGTTYDPNKPYVEIEANERVRVRRVTHLSEEVLKDLLQRIDKIYVKVRRMQDNEIKKAHQEFWERNGQRKEKIECELYNVTEELKKSLPDNLDDGKVPLEFELDEKTNRKLNLLTKIENKTTDEVVENVITKHLDEVKDGKICFFCNKKIIGMGNNPKPISDTGRCCDNCNTTKVIPARLSDPNWGRKEAEILKNFVEQKTLNLDALKDVSNMKYKERFFNLFKEGFDIEELYAHYNIPVEDRLKKFQILTSFFKGGLKKGVAGGTEEQQIANSFLYQNIILPIIDAPDEKKKGYFIDDALAEGILKRKNYPEKLLPYPYTIVDCALPVEDRFYIGFICFKTTSPDLRDNEATTVVTCYIEKEGDVYSLGEEWIVLEKEVGESFKIKDSKYIKKIRNFIFGVLSFIHEPDVEIFDHPLNPRNNQRRVEKGRHPLPSFMTVTLKEKKRIYLEKHNCLPPHPRTIEYQQNVKSGYIHFYNKKKYRRLYALYEEDRQDCLKRGYEWYPPKQVLRKEKKGFTKYKNLPIRNVSYILEDERYKDKIKLKKQDVKKIMEETS